MGTYLHILFEEEVDVAKARFSYQALSQISLIHP